MKQSWIFRFSLFLILSISMIHAQAEQKKQEKPALVMNSTLAFTSFQILGARNYMKRVRWTDETIDSHFKEKNSPWNQCVKAALLGGEDRLLKTADVLVETFNKKENLSFKSLDRESLHQHLLSIQQLLQSYDCFLAIPETAQIDPNVVSNVRDSLNEFTAWFFEETPGEINPADLILLQTARLYAGLLTNSTELVEKCVRGAEGGPGLEAILKESQFGEAWAPAVTVDSYIPVCSSLLQVMNALKNRESDHFYRLAPSTRKFSGAACAMLFPHMSLPTILQTQEEAIQNIDVDAARIEFLERAYSFYGETKYLAILKSAYQTRLRRPGALLYGETPTQTGSSTAYESFVLPRAGAAVLSNGSGSVPLSLFVDTGASVQLGNPTLFSIEIQTNQGKINSSIPKIGTAGYNTIMLNGAPHRNPDLENDEAPNALIHSIRHFLDGSSYINVSASGRYTEYYPYAPGYFERSLYAGSSCVVDFFRLQGSGAHDYIYHSAHSIQEASGEEWKPFFASSSDLELFTHSSSTKACSKKGIYNVDFRANDSDGVSERLWFVDPIGSQLIVGENGPHSFIVCRRNFLEMAGNLFAVFHELYTGKTPEVTNVERLVLEPRPNERDFQAVGFAVERGDDFDIYLSATSNKVKYTSTYRAGRIVFQGKFGHIRYKKGSFDQLAITGGTLLRYDAHSVTLQSAMMTGVIGKIESATGSIEVNFPQPLPTDPNLQGSSLLAVSLAQNPVMFQSLLTGATKTGTTSQTVLLDLYPNITNPLPYLAPPVRSGDQVLFETFAELIRIKGGYYRFAYSAPADIMIPGEDQWNRVFLRKVETMQRVRGESNAGMILFHVDPSESAGGIIEFFASP